MQTAFYLPDLALYRETTTGDRARLAYLWPFSQALAATIDLVAMPHGERYLPAAEALRRGADRYWDPRAPAGYSSGVMLPLGSGGDRFYDDNAWIALELARYSLIAGDTAALERARQVFGFVMSGWDDDPCHPAPGGVFWTEGSWNRDRNTVSNGPGAELGLRLCEITHEQSYLDWAARMYDWAYRSMYAPNGLFWDHVNLQGNIDTTQWTYNQGAMIGANVLFHRVTGDLVYLERAESIAGATLREFPTERLDGQPPAFNAIFLKNLLLLYAVNGNAAYIDAMQAYADRMWDSRRDSATGLFDASLLDHAAIVQVLATLAWDPWQYGKMS
jgi:uncharacterized protein YyaL (SSP411 family)